jgi:hypothetical protein
MMVATITINVNASTGMDVFRNLMAALADFVVTSGQSEIHILTATVPEEKHGN